MRIAVGLVLNFHLSPHSVANALICFPSLQHFSVESASLQPGTQLLREMTFSRVFFSLHFCMTSQVLFIL